jgi:hypothetical protein
MMTKIIGIHGAFSKARDGAALHERHRRVPGLEIAEWQGVVFAPRIAVQELGAGTV